MYSAVKKKESWAPRDSGRRPLEHMSFGQTSVRSEGASPVTTWEKRAPSSKNKYSQVPETQLCWRNGKKVNAQH